MQRRRWFLAAILCLSGWLLTAAAAAAQTGTMSPAVYWQTLEEIAAQLDDLENRPVAEQAAALAAAANRLATITAVELPDGSRLALDHTLLLAELRANPPDLPRLRHVLAAWLETSRTWPEAQFDAADEAALAAILERREFDYGQASAPPNFPQAGTPGAVQPAPGATEQPDDGPPDPNGTENNAGAEESDAGESWRDVLNQRLIEFANWIFPDDLGFFGSLLRFVLVVASVVGLAVVLTFIIRNLFQDFVAETRLPVAETTGPLTAATALKQAETLSNQGDYRDAVRYLYLSSLLLLEEHGLLRYDRSRTNREYLRGVSDQPQLFAILRDVVDVFDRVWYGYRPISEAEYRRFQDQVESLKRIR